jgi:hypothetical protein
MTFGGTMDYHFVQGDQNSKLQVTCVRDDTGAAIDVSSATVNLYWSMNEGTTQTSEMDDEDAANGVVSYTWGDGELGAGQLKCEVEILSGGLPLTSIEAMRFTVRERLP